MENYYYVQLGRTRLQLTATSVPVSCSLMVSWSPSLFLSLKTQHPQDVGLIILLTLDLLEETLEVNALRPLNGQTKRSIPDQLRQRTQTARYTECGCVVQSLVESVVVEENSRRAVDVGVRVFRLAVLLEDLGCDLAVHLDELEDGVLCDFGAGRGVVHESLETGVRLAEDGVTIAGDDAAGVEGGPEVVVDVLLAVSGGNGLLHLDDPAKDLLGGKATS